MRVGTRGLAVTAVVGLMASLIASPTFAHPDHGEGGYKYEGLEVKYDRSDWPDSSEDAPGRGPGNGRGAERGNAPATFAPCIQGMAANFFPCDGVDMLSHVSHEELGTTFVNDIWGWTDPQDGSDYALVGSSDGTVFVDITDPKRPDVLGMLPTHSDVGGDSWRDIKVHDDHAFVVSEHSNHGVQVFDLTRLRDWDGTYTTYDEDAHYDGHGSAHNIVINEDTGYAYSVGAAQTRDDIDCGDGLHMIDISDPTDPTFAGCFQEHGYVHDAQCVVYEGPDERYRDRELCFNSIGRAYTTADGSNFVSIVDVTDKGNPVAIALEQYEGSGYSHQGWLTPDQAHFLHGDEGDEILTGVNTTTRVWDMTDLEGPELIQVFENDTTSIDHNLYTLGDYTYASNYTSGLRVYDHSDLAGEGLHEVAYFDVYPENQDATFEGGTWSNYPYFNQKGVVAVSSIDRGLFILQPRVSRAGN